MGECAKLTVTMGCAKLSAISTRRLSPLQSPICRVNVYACC